MGKYPFFISTISGSDLLSVGMQPVTDQRIIALQRAIASTLSPYWSDVNWEVEIPKHWVNVDLVPVSCDGPSYGVKPLRELNTIMHDLQERLRVRGETLEDRIVALIGLNDDAMAAYAALASALQRSLSPLQIVMVIGVCWNGESWDVMEIIPQPYEISWEDTAVH